MKSKKLILSFIAIVTILLFVNILITHAQTWINLPPYNTLWPLWSSVLSPLNALGIPTPLVSSLKPDTILPVQPCLTWDPNLNYPWLLYNTPLGMTHYDPLFGIDLWPPAYLLDPFGIPLPINLSLIKGWSLLKPTSTSWLSATLPVANNAYYSSYPQFAPLLTTSLIAGLILVP